MSKVPEWEEGRRLAILVEVGKGKLPTRGSAEAASLDLYASEHVVIPLSSRAKVPLSIKFQVPEGTYGRIALRSGLASRGIDVAAGVVDRDYTGEVQVILVNNTSSPFEVAVGDRVAQLIMEQCANAEVRQVKKLPETRRGAQRFGSTGV